jgi:hypothetical protein
MPTLINGLAISDAVARDGLPRVAIDDTGAQHVLYLPEGITIPHSKLASDWPGALPTEPTPTESEAAIAAHETARGDRHADALLRRQGARNLAESAVGVKVGQLTPRQVEALLGLLLLQSGALDDGLLVRPLDEWAG